MILNSNYKQHLPDFDVQDNPYNEAINVVNEVLLYCSKRIKKDLPSRIAQDTHQINFVLQTLLGNCFRGAIIEQSLENEYISYSDDEKRVMLGAYMVI